MTNLHKRWLLQTAAWTAVAAATAALAGCGKKEEAAPAAAPVAPASAKSEPLKIAFMYVSPIGDGGWTYQHELGRRAIQDKFGDKIVTSFVELPPFRGHFPTERKSPTCQDLNHPTRKPFATKWSNWCAAAALQVHCPRSLAATPPVS